MFSNYDHRQWRISRADVRHTWVIVAITLVTAGIFAAL
jgi:hypothetical protein